MKPVAVDLLDEMRDIIDRSHYHREYGYFGYMGMAATKLRRVGRAGCRPCEIIGREPHEHDGPNGPYIPGGACLAWSDDER